MTDTPKQHGYDLLLYLEDLLLSKETLAYFAILKDIHKNSKNIKIIRFTANKLFSYTVLRCYELAFTKYSDSASVHNFIKFHGEEVWGIKYKSEFNKKFDSYLNNHKSNLEDLRHRVAHTVKYLDSKNLGLPLGELFIAIEDLKPLIQEIIIKTENLKAPLNKVSMLMKKEIHDTYKKLIPEELHKEAFERLTQL